MIGCRRLSPRRLTSHTHWHEFKVLLLVADHYYSIGNEDSYKCMHIEHSTHKLLLDLPLPSPFHVVVLPRIRTSSGRSVQSTGPDCSPVKAEEDGSPEAAGSKEVEAVVE